VPGRRPNRPRAEEPEGPDKREILKRYDGDGDGRLSRKEKEALRKDIVEGRVQVPPALRERFRRGGRPGRPGKRPPENVTIQRDVEYGRAGECSLRLDIIRSKHSGDSPLPAIVFIHGGAWRGGNKAGGIGRLAPFAASGNYVCATVEYRLSGEAIWPAQIHDCKAAIRWLKANAEKYNIDPRRIGVWGTSAGGHLVNMLGTSGGVKELEGGCGSPEQSSRVACVVAFCGPSNLLAAKKLGGGREPSAVTRLLGGTVGEKKAAAKSASPITYVTSDDPPMLLVHGTRDPIVPLEQAELLHAALQAAGVDSTLVKIEGGGHGIGGPEVLKRVEAFFNKHLRGKAEGGRRKADTPLPPSSAYTSSSRTFMP